MMNRIILICGLFLLSFSSFGEGLKTVLSEMKKAYASAENFECSVVYDLYKGHASNMVNTSYTGYFLRKGKRIYQKIKSTEFIYGTDFFLKINGDEHLMQLNRAVKYESQQIDIDLALKECSEQKLEEKADYYSVKLTFNPTSQNPFSVVYFRVDKKTHFLLQIDIYYSLVEDFSTDRSHKDEAQPHLKIRYSAITTKPVASSKLFDLTTYIKHEHGAYVPIGHYAGFEVLDERNN